MHSLQCRSSWYTDPRILTTPSTPPSINATSNLTFSTCRLLLLCCGLLRYLCNTVRLMDAMTQNTHHPLPPAFEPLLPHVFDEPLAVGRGQIWLPASCLGSVRRSHRNDPTLRMQLGISVCSSLLIRGFPVPSCQPGAFIPDGITNLSFRDNSGTAVCGAVLAFAFSPCLVSVAC